MNMASFLTKTSCLRRFACGEDFFSKKARKFKEWLETSRVTSWLPDKTKKIYGCGVQSGLLDSMKRVIGGIYRAVYKNAGWGLIIGGWATANPLLIVAGLHLRHITATSGENSKSSFYDAKEWFKKSFLERGDKQIPSGTDSRKKLSSEEQIEMLTNTVMKNNQQIAALTNMMQDQQRNPAPAVSMSGQGRG